METQNERDIKTLNHCGIGISKLRQIYHCSPNKIQAILVKSANKIDTRNNINKVYNEQLIHKIDYFVDSSKCKMKPLTSHDRQTLTNFPKMYFIGNNKGELVSFYLVHAKAEYAFHYSQCIIKANLPKSSVIHIDIYSTKLFTELENRGYKVCHINKRLRLKELNIPFSQQVEHLFANIQKAVRRIKLFDVRELSKQQAKDLVIGLIFLYHRNQQHKYLETVKGIIAIKNKVVVKQ